MKFENWRIKKTDRESAKTIAEELSISEVMATLLVNRHVKTPEKARLYLNGTRNDLYDPFLMKGVKEAVIRIKKAVDNKEKIAVFGDYDVDGITSTAIMVKFFKRLGVDICYVIPSRIEHGYGLNVSDLEECLKKGIDLVITVDCGISNADEIDFAVKNNIDAIIIDHHNPPERLPAACAIVNPKQTDCQYPFSELAAVGVVFKLVSALCKEFSMEMQDEYFMLAALGTVADIVPLIDENRIIVKEGLKTFMSCGNKGIKSLMRVCNLNSVSSGKISFILAPRINAVGRINDPYKAVELLITDDYGTADKLAVMLDSFNRKRQEIETTILRQALEMINRKAAHYTPRKVLVLASDKWHVGVIGIVTSKIKEIYHKPTILIAEEGGECRGSGRSIHGFDLFRAVEQSSEFLEKFGGHEMAAGFSIKKENIAAFDDAINAYAEKMVTEEMMSSSVDVDMKLDVNMIDLAFAEEVALIKPFGCHNPQPVFMSEKVSLIDTKVVGPKRNHLKAKVRKKRGTIDAIGFDLVDDEDDEVYSPAQLFDIAYDVDINNWNNMYDVQLRLKDIRYNQSEDFEFFFKGDDNES